MPLRYNSHINLDNIGPIGQKKMLSTTTVIVGCGGLGNVVIPSLVGSGINVIIFDGDDIEYSNLHRQTHFTKEDVGKNKALTLEKHLRKLNNDSNIVAYDHYATLEDIEALDLPNNAIIVDCADSFKVSYMLNDFCMKNGYYFVSGSAIKNSGHVGIFCNDCPSYRDVIFNISNENSCNDVGVVSSTVGIIGNLQVRLIFDIIVGNKEKFGKFYLWNDSKFSLDAIDFSGMI